MYRWDRRAFVGALVFFGAGALVFFGAGALIFLGAGDRDRVRMLQK